MRTARRRARGRVRAREQLAAFARRLPSRRPRAVVLVYHRVSERGIDPWRLTVDPETFHDQMKTVARDWCPLSLDELVDGLAARRLPDRAVAVTFDDGYADNLEIAAPILVERGIPATLFVATGLVGAERSPWWDELTSLLLEPERLPPTLTLSSFNGGPWQIPRRSAGARELVGDPPQPWVAKLGTRLRAFYELWIALRALDTPTREAALDEIAEWAGAERASDRTLLTLDQLRELAALPGLQLGAHTITHPSLPSRPPAEARAEIAGSAEWLRAHVGIEVDQFAYPHGEWDESLARLVGGLGFRCAYTTDGGAISWNSTPHGLPRVPVEAHAGSAFARLLTDLAGR